MKSDQFRIEAEHRRVLEVAQAAHARAVVHAIASATVSADSKQREQLRVMLSAAIDEFARFKLAKKEWRGKTEGKMRAALELFARAVGDQP